MFLCYCIYVLLILVVYQLLALVAEIDNQPDLIGVFR